MAGQALYEKAFSMIKLRAILILLVCLLASAVAARAEMRVVGYVMSDQSAPDILKLEDTAFIPLREGQSLGFLEGPIWVKLVIDSQPPPTQMFLSVQPIHLDHIAIYDARHPQEPIYRGGDAVRSPLSVQRNGYTLQLADDAFGGTFLVRLESHNLMQPKFNIFSSTEILQLEQILGLSFSVAFSATLFYLLWAATAAFLMPSWLLASYMLRLGFYLAVLFIHSGTLRLLLATDSLPAQDLIHNLSALGYITIAQVFDYMLLRELRGRWGPRLFLAIIVGFTLLKFFAFSTGEVAFALQINNLSALMTLCLAIFVVLAAPRNLGEDWRISKVSLAFYFVMQAVPLAVLMLAVKLQSERYSMLMDVAFLNYSILPGAYVTYLLFCRHRRLMDEQRHMEEQKNALRTIARIESEKRTEIGNLLQMLTHEVKTPLAMLQMSQTVGELDEALVTKAVGTIRHILQQCDRVDEIENGNLKVEMGPVDLRLAVLKASRDSGIEVQIAPDITAQAFADLNLLQIVLQNLLHNAYKYHRPSTVISAEILIDEDKITLRLANVNRSQTLPDPDRMFEKYYRHSGAMAQTGTGLGLYIVSQLCRRMSTTVYAETEADQVILVLRFSHVPDSGVGK